MAYHQLLFAPIPFLTYVRFHAGDVRQYTPPEADLRCRFSEYFRTCVNTWAKLTIFGHEVH